MQSFQRKPDKMGGSCAPVQRVSAPSRVVTNNRPSAVRQLKLQQSIAKGGPVIQRVWHPVRGQDGEFEGNEGYHHVHRIGTEGTANEHYRYGSGRRKDFMRGGEVNYQDLEDAISDCEQDLARENAGQEECLAYMRGLLAVTPKPAPPTPKSVAPVKKATGKTAPVKRGKFDGKVVAVKEPW